MSNGINADIDFDQTATFFLVLAIALRVYGFVEFGKVFFILGITVAVVGFVFAIALLAIAFVGWLT